MLPTAGGVVGTGVVAASRSGALDDLANAGRAIASSGVDDVAPQGPLAVVSTHGSARGIGFDTNALVARLEGSPQLQTAVETAMAGRAPVIPWRTGVEFLKKGDKGALSEFLRGSGGRVLPPASPRSTALFRPYLSEEDASILGGAYEAGVQVLTRDEEILANTIGIAVRF